MNRPHFVHPFIHQRMFVLLPCFSWNRAVVSRGMQCLCKPLLSPLLGTFPHLALLAHVANSVFNCLRHCVVNGLCTILSPPTEHKWSFLYILANTYYFMGFWINMRYFNEQLPPWAPGTQSFWGLWEVPWNCPHQGTRKLAYFSTKSCLLVEVDLPWPSGGEL